MSEKKRALLIDDNEATRTLMAAILKKEFEIEVADEGAMAIEKLRNRRYDAILLDLRMPRVDGFAVLQFLKESSPQMMRRVVVVTAALSSAELRRAESYSIAALVRKPFEIEDLLAAVQRCCGGDDEPMGSDLFSSAPVILLLAQMIAHRWI